ADGFRCHSPPERSPPEQGRAILRKLPQRRGAKGSALHPVPAALSRCKRFVVLRLGNLFLDLLSCHRKLKSVVLLSHQFRRNKNLCAHQGWLQLRSDGLLSVVHSNLG